jgi:hypothetical protein
MFGKVFLAALLLVKRGTSNEYAPSGVERI